MQYRLRFAPRALLFCVFAFEALLAGCERRLERPDRPIIREEDGGTLPLGRPVIDSPPPGVLPWPLVTLRGRAEGAERVIVRGGSNPVAARVLPDGTFCVDVELPADGVYTFEIASQRGSGPLSEVVTVSTELDRGAPPPQPPPTCGGADPRGCEGSVEDCGNGQDDDCDSRVDGSDSECAECPPDLLEPNDDLASSARIPPGSYRDLGICPADLDHYPIWLGIDETLTVEIRFVHDEADLDVALYDSELELIGSSNGTQDTESIVFVAPEDGVYLLQVYSADSGTAGYDMDITVD